MVFSNPPEEQPAPTGADKKLRAVVIVGIVCLLGGLAARHFLYTAADESNFDESPLPRQGLNAPYIKTPDPVVEKMVELAQLTENDLVYDLGCGDGRIVITAALRTGCRGVGFDINPERVAEARENAKRNGVEGRVTIEEQDVFKVDLSKADAAIMYLLPWMMNKLLPQFEQMKPGARIVAHDYWIDCVEPDKYVEVPTANRTDGHGIYLYTTPLKKNPAMEKGKPPRPTDSPRPPTAPASDP
jgi:SAM-dependent methyltransferase